MYLTDLNNISIIVYKKRCSEWYKKSLNFVKKCT